MIRPAPGVRAARLIVRNCAEVGSKVLARRLLTQRCVSWVGQEKDF